MSARELVLVEAETPTETMFIEAMDKLQGQWFGLLLTIGFNQDFMNNEFRDCRANFTPPISDTWMFEEMFRCGNTAHFLWKMLEGPSHGDLLDENREVMRTRNRANKMLIDGVTTDARPDDINLYLIVMGGMLPDHAMILVRINDSYFVMQSFVHTYTFSSKYGFFRVNDINHFLGMLYIFQAMADTKFNEELVDMNDAQQKLYDDVRERFAVYTHVDIDRLWEETEHRRTILDVSKMGIIRHTIPAESVPLIMRGVSLKACTGFLRAFQSRARPLVASSSSSSSTGHTYNVTIRNWLLGEDRFTRDDFDGKQKLADKLADVAGFNGHKYKIEMIDLEYGNKLQLTFLDKEHTEVDKFVVSFKIRVSLHELIFKGMEEVFDCGFGDLARLGIGRPI